MEYEIENFCEKICKIFNCNPVWDPADIENFNNKHRTIIVRKNFCKEKGNKKYKFIEYTCWDEKKDFCVMIGFNPAETNPNTLDKTNEKLIKNPFFENFGGVVLLNLYPQVSKTKAEFEDNDEIDNMYQEKFVEILDYIAEFQKKIVIFWGRTVSIDKKIKDKIEQFPSGYLYKTVKKDDGENNHYHPARVEIDIKPLTIEDFKGSYYLQ